MKEPPCIFHLDITTLAATAMSVPRSGLALHKVTKLRGGSPQVNYTDFTSPSTGWCLSIQATCAVYPSDKGGVSILPPLCFLGFKKKGRVKVKSTRETVSKSVDGKQEEEFEMEKEENEEKTVEEVEEEKEQ